MTVDQLSLHQIRTLSQDQLSSLRIAGFNCARDLLLASPRELERVLKLPLAGIRALLRSVSKELSEAHARCKPLADFNHNHHATTFSTGDERIDLLLGGGIRTGMLWEVAGESSSGKTQLCLQLSLSVQLDSQLGGISGGTCYITTGVGLATKRLVQLQNEHPKFSPDLCSLADVHTLSAATIDVLMHVLTVKLPGLQTSLSSQEGRKPIRLVVIDSIAPLFQSVQPRTSNYLFERAKALSELSRVVHNLAHACSIAFVVVNEVSDVIVEPSSGVASSKDILYREQSRWFSSAPFPPMPVKEASLGLVWANQINARVMLAKTNKRVRVPLDMGQSKRTKVSKAPMAVPITNSEHTNDYTTVRMLTIIFSTVSMPAAIDFIVLESGVASVGEQDLPPRALEQKPKLPELPTSGDRGNHKSASAEAAPTSDALEAWDGLEGDVNTADLTDFLLDDDDEPF